MIRTHPSLFLHLIKIKANPLKVVLPWIQFGFMGFLNVDQVLVFWDRLVAFDCDLILLAITSAALFVFKADYLLEVSFLFFFFVVSAVVV